MANRPNEVLHNYIVSVATSPLDDLTKEGINNVPEDITKTIEEKGSTYLSGFAVAFHVAYQLLDGLTINPLSVELGKVVDNKIVHTVMNNIIRTSAIFKAIEYVTCRTLFERGYTIEEDQNRRLLH